MYGSFWEELTRFFGYYNLVFLGSAFLYTAALSVLGCGIGFAAGFILGVVRHERIVRFAPVRWVALLYVEIFRRIPFLVKLMCVFFAFQLSGANVTMFTVAATTVALSAAAFSAENVRAGLEGVHRNQWDAAEAMNMGGLAALRLTVLPQAWRIIIPPSMTYSVGLVKSTSIASQIGVIELTYAAKVLNSRGFSAALCFGTILVLYFVLCYSLNRFATWLDRRLDVRGRRELPPRGAALTARLQTQSAA
jgi:polar amino acid transport system permease protein